MQMETNSATSVHDRSRHPTTGLSTPLFRRGALLVFCSASVALAAALGHPDAAILGDPQLAFLLRGMAALKALMVLAAAAVCFWRLGRPTPFRTAAVYVVGSAALAGASMLIWRLSSIPLAAVVFHLAGFAILVAAWRDEAVTLKFVRRSRRVPQRGQNTDLAYGTRSVTSPTGSATQGRIQPSSFSSGLTPGHIVL